MQINMQTTFSTEVNFISNTVNLRFDPLFGGIGETYATVFEISSVETGKIDSQLVRDVTKFAFEFDDIQTLNVFTRFEIRRIFHDPSSNSNVRSTRLSGIMATP